MNKPDIPPAAQGPWPAPAKLNLILHVTGRRADGYHELQTVFQFLDYADQLYFALRDDGEIRRHGGPEGVAATDDLCVRAAGLLQAHGCAAQGVDIYNEKVLPAGGGLGGGSSDAATTLWALNRLWGLGLDTGAQADTIRSKTSALLEHTGLYEQLTAQSIFAADDGLTGQGQFRFHYTLPGFELTAPMEDTTR